MNIDWFTYAAQIVNFLLLVALLRWLLYDRIVRAMNQREEKIAGRLQEAERKWTRAEEKGRQYEAKLQQLDREREQQLQAARREAQEEQQRLLQQARDEVDRQRQEWQEAYRRERDDLLHDLRRQAGKTSVALARRILSQLADVDLEHRICEAFTARLRQIGDAQREEIARQLGNGEASVAILSALDVPEERREHLRKTLRDAFDYEGEIAFAESKDLVCGLELDVGGYSIGWNVKELLQDLELQFDERLKALR